MTNKILRFAGQMTVTIASGGAVSDALDIGEWAGGVLLVPSGYGENLTLTFQVAEAEDGTYLDLHDKDGTQLSVTMVAGDAFEIPEQVFLAEWLKLKIGANASADATLYLSCKG
jgi:hypothetical protein